MSVTDRPTQGEDRSFEPDNHEMAHGNGGETHQWTEGNQQTLTTQQGTPVSDDQNSLRGGAGGPVLLEDFVLREKLFHFDHERIPERVVHARGYGARGVFELTDSLEQFTSANILTEVGQATEVFVRFSTVAGRAGSVDLPRDVRGFAVKFYTEQGNWDLVGNNIPVFFIQDAMKFPDLVHAVKEEPDRGFPQAQSAHDNFWDFITLMPESWHMIMWKMSDRTIPRSFRTIEGFGVHSFRLINAAGASTFVKFHWKPHQGLQSVVWPEAVKINGADPDFHRRDLWDAISRGDFPKWDLAVQLFDEDEAASFPFDHLDATKLIPEELVPLRRIGTLTLNQNVDNLFAETEQVAFCTQNILPGMDFSDDPLLQGRNFSYLDTQLKRLGGPNFTHIPVNAPRCPVRHFQQDGHMAMSNPVGRANYEPNSWTDGGPRENPAAGFRNAAARTPGDKTRIRPASFADHYSQARQFSKSQLPVEQLHIVEALTFELSKCERVDIRVRALSHLLNIDADLAQAVATALRLDLPAPAAAARPTLDLPPSAALSILANGPRSFAGRKLGILVTDETDANIFAALASACEGEGGIYEVIAPSIGGVRLDNGQTLTAKHQLAGAPSVLFDAIAVLASPDKVTSLAALPAARDFVADAIAHGKFIGLSADAQTLLANASPMASQYDGAMVLDGLKAPGRFMKACSALRIWAPSRGSAVPD